MILSGLSNVSIRHTSSSLRQMNSTRIWTTCLKAAGLNSLAMAVPHFFLPAIFDWSSKLETVHPIFPWALGVFNFSWSLMLLLTSVLVLRIAKKGPTASRQTRWIIGGLGVYWLIHGTYLIVVPPPMPTHLAWLNWVLMAFPLVVSTLHLAPLWLTRDLSQLPSDHTTS